MKRLIVAAASVGALALAMVGTTASADASTVHHAANHGVRTSTSPTVSVSQTGDLKPGDKVTVSGSGWPAKASLVIAECNGDGAGPGALGGSCDTKALGSTTASSTGTFSKSFTIATPGWSTQPNTYCPPGLVEAEHSVACIIGVADLSSKQFAFRPIFFTAPAFSISEKKSTIVNGKQTWAVTITESGDYATQGIGGYEVIGAYGHATPPSRDCQPSRNDSSVWTGTGAPGLPVCTIHFGEVVQVNWEGMKVALLRVGSTSNPGDFSYTYPHAWAGTHSIVARGLESGEQVSATYTVG